jgi:hypothetical protein
VKCGGRPHGAEADDDDVERAGHSPASVAERGVGCENEENAACRVRLKQSYLRAPDAARIC